MQVSLANQALIKHLRSMAEDVAAVDPSLGEKLNEVHEKLATPCLFDETFPMEDDDEDEKDVKSGDEGSGVPAKSKSSNYLEGLQASCSKGVGLFAEMHKKIYSGEYADAQRCLGTSNSMEEVLHKMSDQDLGLFATDLKECMKCLRAAEAVVSAKGGSASAPQPSLRQLARQASDGHDAEAAQNERADVWRRTTSQRKKCVTLVSVKNPKAKASYSATVAKFTAFKDFHY